MDIPERVKKIWGTWDIRIFLLLSLLLQILLVLLAPLRKRNKKKQVGWFIWFVYLMADWVAIFALGLLSSNRDEYSGPNEENDLLALWAPFLLLHLGGPDAITAFALEDNELWLRHFLGLIYQLVPAVYVLLRSFPGNQLLAPTILIFIVGVIKYCERTWALYQASSDVFGENLTGGENSVPDYEELMEKYMATQQIQRSTEPEGIKTMDVVLEGFSDHLDHINMVQFAYHFFHTFKGLLVSVPLSYDDLSGIQRFFVRWSANDAFRIIEIELNLMYEVLFTKASVVHSRIGYILRFISICSIITAVLYIFLSLEINRYNYFHIAITYTLFMGAVGMEAIGLFNLIFSDWSIITLKNYSKFVYFISKFHLFLFGGSRWSESVPQLSLITITLYGLPKWVEKTVGSLALKSILDEIRHGSRKPVSDYLKLFIFEKLKKNADIDTSQKKRPKKLNPKGKWAKVAKFIKKTPYVIPVSSVVENFDESFLVLHIATELCYHSQKIIVNLEDPMNFSWTGRSKSTTKKRDSRYFPAECEISKILSDYMFYLMVMHPTMMPSLGLWKIRYQDTCVRVKEMFGNMNLRYKQDLPDACQRLLGNRHPDACQRLLRKRRRNCPQNGSIGGSRSVLRDAAVLASKLLEADEVTRWVTISNRWVEMLCYVASHSRGKMHAQQLGKGGELLTFVWLLMAHLGFSRDHVK